MGLVATTFGEMFDFTRASSATYWDDQGLLKTAASDEARFTHDPVTGEVLGVLVEPTATNLLLQSSDSTAAEWVQTNGWDRARSTEVGSPSSTAGEVDKLTATAENPSNCARQVVNLTGVTGEPHAASLFVFIPSGQAPDLQMSADFDDRDNFNEVDILPGDLDRWVRLVDMVATPTADVNRVDFMVISSTGNIPVGFVMYTARFQLEAGSRSSSSIETTNSRVTRASDDLARTLGVEHNPDGFSFYVEGDQQSDAGALAYFSDGTFGNSLRVGLPSSLTGVMALSGTSTGSASIPLSTFTSYVPGTPAKIAVSVSDTTLTVALNGESHSTSISGVPAVDRVNIGSMGGDVNVIDGHVRNFRIYPTVLTEAKLVEMTS